MDLCDELCSSGRGVGVRGRGGGGGGQASWPSCMTKNFNTGHYSYTLTVEPDFFIPILLTGTIDLYHFIPLPLTLTLP